ncbi:MAG: type VI secretion system baseplate subunit TssK [Desulfobacterales bacterium]|nr:type VI secretion system baseplate subunit TssK [Desulfobacterales bacterium]
MNVNRPLFWHQGLFLQPHHFQQQDLYFQSLLAPYQQYIQPHLWGVGDLEIQDSALDSGTFLINRGEFLFPDQSYVTFPGNAVIEARSFGDTWLEGEKPLMIYLGIRKLNFSGENVTVLPSLDNLADTTSRYVTSADTESTADLYQDSKAAEMKRLFYLLRIFWDSEIDQAGDYSIIPLAQLERSGDEVLLSQQFVPACLNIAVSDSLYNMIGDIRDQIASRGYQLESYKRERGIHTAEFGARDMVYLLALRSLNRYTPLLSHMAESGQVHPWAAYGVVKQLIGELSSFSEEVNVLGETEDLLVRLHKYDHRNLYSCFHSAQKLVTRLLEEITAGPEYMIELIYDGTYFGAELKPNMFEGNNRFYLVMSTEQNPQEVITALETIAKLSSRETLPILIARALSGINLLHLSVPPQDLPRRANSIYFQIEHQSEQWAQVENGNNIALYWDLAPDDLKVELMIVGRS